jgi:phosphate transport system protein
MAIRKTFDKELALLKEKILTMGSLSGNALRQSVEALKIQDMTMAQQVVNGDQQINNLEIEIEELVVKIIASQQPVASDLRKIMAALKISTGLERMGDFAVDISKATLRIGTEPLIKPLNDLPVMGDIVQNMLREVLNAYIDENVELAQEMASMDDKVDKMYSTIVKDLLNKMVEEPTKIEQVMLLSFVARYIERVADYVTNIAEAITYSVKGKRVDLNQ